jgi:hypothetical protein
MQVLEMGNPWQHSFRVAHLKDSMVMKVFPPVRYFGQKR